MFKEGNAFILVMCVLALSACGMQPKFNAVNNNGHRSENLGVVVDLEKATGVEVAAFFDELNSKFPAAKVKTVNLKHHLYEIFDVTEKDLKSLAPDPDRVFDNIYFKVVPPRALQNIPAADLFAGIANCKTVFNGPIADITPQTLSVELQMGQIDINDGTVIMTAKNSKRGKSNLPLKYRWALYAPTGSVYQNLTLNGEKLTLTPDLAGGYEILLLVYNSKFECSGTSFNFGVTENVAYKGWQQPRQLTDPDRMRFHQLTVLQAEPAWKYTKGKGIVIAIVDTGVNYNHPDLAANLLKNSNEIPGNGKDDDFNGYVDDVLGWDFYNNDNIPYDDNMHGTHVTGISSSAVTGIAPKAKYLAVKALSAEGGGSLVGVLGAFKYAADRGADIINASIGFDTHFYTQIQRDRMREEFDLVLDYLNQRSVLLVVAAGNGDPIEGIGFNIELMPVFPASLSGFNLISVAAVTGSGGLTGYSNFGKTSVDIAAPGGTSNKPINSTFYAPHIGQYIGIGGTSMASPMVAGVAALVEALKPNWSPSSIRYHLNDTSVYSTLLDGLIVSDGQVNALNAVKGTGVFLPLTMQ